MYNMSCTSSCEKALLLATQAMEACLIHKVFYESVRNADHDEIVGDALDRS
jgi:hypothetical protein